MMTNELLSEEAQDEYFNLRKMKRPDPAFYRAMRSKRNVGSNTNDNLKRARTVADYLKLRKLKRSMTREEYMKLRKMKK